MKFLVTGGSGFLGINVIRHLLKNNHQVVSLDVLPFDYPEKSDITVHQGDIRDSEVVAKAMAGVDMVIHTAAALPLYSPEEIHTTDVEGTRLLLKEAEATGVKRFIHISSTAVYGIPDHHPLRENDKLSGVGPYGKAKIEAEEECEAARKRGLCVAILRPKTFVGPERLGVFALFYDWVKDGCDFPMIGSGKNRYQLLDVEDLCDAIYLCTTKDEKVANDTFNIGAKRFTTMKEDYQAVINSAGTNGKVVGLPASPIIAILRLLEKLRLSPLYKWVYETAHKDSFVSIDKAMQKLGYKPKYSNKDALIRNYQWYLAHLEDFSGQSGVTHRVPWKQGILGLAKQFFKLTAKMRQTTNHEGEARIKWWPVWVLAIFTIVGWFMVKYPFFYLESDSFTYFTMVKQFHEFGLLYSFSGIDHTIGIHHLYYFFLLPWYPLVGLQLPAFSFVLNFVVMFGALVFLRRTYGDVVSLIVAGLLLLPPYSAAINNGMESTLAMLGLVLALYTIHKYQSKQLVDSLKPLFLIGAALGLTLFARLDLVFVAVAFGLVWSVYFWQQHRFKFKFEQIKRYLTGGLAFGLPILAFFGAVVSLNYGFGDGAVSIAAEIKSSFPEVQPGFVAKLSHYKFEFFSLASLIGFFYLVYKYCHKKSLPISMVTLWLGCVLFGGYNILFVYPHHIGYWYNTIPILLLAIFVAKFIVLLVNKIARRLSVSVKLLSLVVIVCLVSVVTAKHISIMINIGKNQMADHRMAMEHLNSVAEPGSAAAENTDGISAFYGQMPVYNLTGLANNNDYQTAIKQGKLNEYFSERSIRYLVTGYNYVPADSIKRGCTDPLYENKRVAVFAIQNCR